MFWELILALIYSSETSLVAREVSIVRLLMSASKNRVPDSLGFVSNPSKSSPFHLAGNTFISSSSSSFLTNLRTSVSKYRGLSLPRILFILL